MNRKKTVEYLPYCKAIEMNIESFCVTCLWKKRKFRIRIEKNAAQTEFRVFFSNQFGLHVRINHSIRYSP